MHYRNIGPRVKKSPQSVLGGMGMNHAYGTPDDQESIATLNRSIELGINFWDTARYLCRWRKWKTGFPGPDTQPREDLYSTKFGFVTRDGELTIGRSPAHLKKAVKKVLSG